MNQREPTPGVFATQHADPEAERSRQRVRQLAYIALEDTFEKRRTEQALLAAEYLKGRAVGREEGFEKRYVEDSRWGMVIGASWTAAAFIVLLVGLAIRNAPGCLP